jgi:hypothetical protein
MSRQSNVDMMAALVGLWAAMATAARLSGDRIGTARREMGGRARQLASESTDRGLLAYHALRGDLPIQTRRRPIGYLAVTALAGAAGAVTVIGIRRVLAQRNAGRAELAPVPDTEVPSTVTRIPSATGNVNG